MKEEIKIIKRMIYLFMLLGTLVFIMQVLMDKKQNERLNEHKRVIIAQQGQINVLIANERIQRQKK